MKEAGDLHILFVCAFLNQHGGFENFVYALARSAVEAGHAVEILTPYEVRRDATIRSLPPAVAFSSAQGTWKRTSLGRFFSLLSQVKLRIRRRRAPTCLEETQLARQRSRPFVERFWLEHGIQLLADADVIHLVGKPKRFVVDAAARATRLENKTVYSEVAHVDRRYAEHPDHRGFVGASNHCDMITAYSELQLSGIRKWFEYSGPGRVIDQYAYVNEADLLKITRDRQLREDDDLVFGTLCRLSPEKDLGIVLRALARARERHPDLRLRVAGTGHLEPELRELSRTLGLQSSVTFLGYVDDTADFYSSVDVFVIASREEGGPITGVEAMAARLPIIATRTNAMPERLRDGQEALFIGVGSVVELSEAMCRLAEDASLRSKLAIGARKRYLERCHSRKCESAMIELWNELANR